MNQATDIVSEHLQQDFIDLRYPRLAAHGITEHALDRRINYLIGDDYSKWHTNIPTFGRVKIAGVYPGIDVIHYGVADSLEYDIVAAPHADTSAIKSSRSKATPRR